MKKLIITADDFGLSVPVNEAIEQAYRDGILRSTSLMVGGTEARDAVVRARRNPGLKIGLHVVVARGRPVLPADEVPDLVDGTGNFHGKLVLSGLRIFFLPKVRKQLEREITAQFEAFRKYGLELDHVNAHNHMHLHPTVFGLILKVGRKYGMRSVRIPYEPLLPVYRATGEAAIQRTLMVVCLGPWVRLLRKRLASAGLFSNEYIFGLFDTGSMGIERVLKLLPQIPNGVSELYFHPAVAGIPGIRPLSTEEACAMELETLLSEKIRECMQSLHIETASFSELADL